MGYYILSIFYDLQDYQLFWLAMVGFTWGFHFTFTISTLLQHQSDIKEYGAVFSYALIYLFNVLGICIWILIVSKVTFEQAFNIALEHFRQTAFAVWSSGVWAFEEIQKLRQ